MSDLKIRVYKHGAENPSSTVTIPGGILRVAANLIPKRAAAKLSEEGIDLAEIARLSENPDAQGTLVTVDDHDKDEKVVIALE